MTEFSAHYIYLRIFIFGNKIFTISTNCCFYCFFLFDPSPWFFSL